MRAYKEATRLAPDDAEIWTRYGHMAADAGNARQAAKAFTRALKLDPKETETWKALGIIYEIELSDAKRAVECYRKYVDRGGDDERVAAWLKDIGER